MKVPMSLDSLKEEEEGTAVISGLLSWYGATLLEAAWSFPKGKEKKDLFQKHISPFVS